jgi:mannose-6-phosphate isomerase-like protein (cupin superfamily)
VSIVLPGSGRRTRALGSTYSTLTDGEAVRGAYSLVEEELWGGATPLHAHDEAEEAFYVLSGRAAVWLAGEETVVAAGTFLVVPRGVPHALRRAGEDPVRFLTAVSPAGLERFFEEVERLGEEALLAEPERLVALAAGYGTRIMGDHPVGDAPSG